MTSPRRRRRHLSWIALCTVLTPSPGLFEGRYRIRISRVTMPLALVTVLAVMSHSPASYACPSSAASRTRLSPQNASIEALRSRAAHLSATVTQREGPTGEAHSENSCAIEGSAEGSSARKWTFLSRKPTPFQKPKPDLDSTPVWSYWQYFSPEPVVRGHSCWASVSSYVTAAARRTTQDVLPAFFSTQ